MDTPRVPENTSLCQILKQEAQKRTDIYRRRAYEKAYDVCVNFPDPITQGSQLRSVRGIGPKIESVIDRYLTDPTSFDPQSDPLALFQSVDGVGPQKAQEWVKKGYTTLNDIPKSELTERQQIAIKYHSEIQERIPRAEIALFGEVLTRWLRRDLKEHQTQFIIAGSYRRGQETSGDIDILVLGDLEVVLKCPLFTHTLVKGDKKWRGLGKVNQLHRRVDLELTTREELPFALLYFTGSKNYNTMMRTEAKKKGYRLNEKGLFRDGQQVKGLKSEEEVVDFLGLEYFDPVDRN